MAFSSRLCNPTPFDIELPWDRGVNIDIPAFGSAELTMQQFDDFRPGKPGSPDVKRTLDYYGLFLLDVDRPYDNQALEALRLSRAGKKSQYDAAIKNIRDRRAAQGIAPNEEALDETLNQMGYAELDNKVKVLDKAIARFAAEVGDSTEQSIRAQLDPKRTVFVLDPPREFPSVAAMEFFLAHNPEINAKHEALNAAQEPAVSSALPEPTQAVQDFISEVASEEQS